MSPGFGAALPAQQHPRAADLGDFAIVNSFVSIVNNTVVQGTIHCVRSRPPRTTRAPARSSARVCACRPGWAWCSRCACWWDRRGSRRSGRRRASRPTSHRALIPLLYAVYAVFVGSANGLRRFRTQASFDVGFSTLKTIMLLGLAAALERDGRVRRFRCRGVRHPDRRGARDAAADQRRAVPDPPHRELHGRAGRVHGAAEPGAQLRPAAAANSRCPRPASTRSPPPPPRATTRRCARRDSAVPGVAGRDVRDLSDGSRARSPPIARPRARTCRRPCATR